MIGEGSWLGQNCVIMPGVVIGRRCIVGSNSVVTTSLPPGSVAVGAPARIIKQWDWEAKLWRKTIRTGHAAEDRRAPDETPGGPAATGNIMPLGMRFAG